MKAVWKYLLTTTGYQELELPANAKLLTVHAQDEMPCLWVLVDPDERKVTQGIWIVGTGELANIEGDYVGTFHLVAGAFVFHVFAEKNKTGEVG